MIHIELVSDLITQAILNALNRCIDRCGRSITIYTDNATIFVGANNTLKKVHIFFRSEQHKKKMQEKLAGIGVFWHFISPRSLHFGGLW